MTSALEQPFDSAIAGWEIAVSVSEPDDGELARRGVSKVHVEHAFDEIARQLLASGATLAYGGDLRRRGYTERLIGLMNNYADGLQPGRQRVRQYLAWSLWEQADAAHRADLNAVATVRPQPAPTADAPDPVAFDRTASPADRALWADALTLMREAMTESMRARVILGGRLTSHTSRFPGVVEEAFLAVRGGRPLYVLGGFGGCASCLAQVIEGQPPPALTEAYQREHTPGYSALVDGLGGVDWNEMLETIRHRRVPNGLSAEDDGTLRETSDLDLVVALVLRGLRALAR
jgi:hypothetical protein